MSEPNQLKSESDSDCESSDKNSSSFTETVNQDFQSVFNKDDNREERIERRRKYAVEYINKFEDVATLLKAKYYFPAIHCIIDSKMDIPFETIHSIETEKESIVTKLG